MIPTKIEPPIDSSFLLEPELINYDFTRQSLDHILSQLKLNGYFYAYNSDTSTALQFYNTLVNSITIQPANDASRRKRHTSNIDNMTTVDLDYPFVDVHSENSFSPSTPELVCFFCFDVDPYLGSSGLTQVVDGQEIWNSLPLSFKQICQSHLIEYQVCISLDRRFKGHGLRDWYLDHIGVSDTYLNLDTQSIHFKYQCFPINNQSLNKRISFANHLFIDLATEPQIQSRKFPGSDALLSSYETTYSIP